MAIPPRRTKSSEPLSPSGSTGGSLCSFSLDESLTATTAASQRRPSWITEDVKPNIVQVKSQRSYWHRAVPFSRIQTQRHRFAYVAGDYLYIANKNVEGKAYLICQQSREFGCRATAVLIEGEPCIRLSDDGDRQHNHAKPDLQNLQFRAAVVNAAREISDIPLVKLYKNMKARFLSNAPTSAEQQKIAAQLTDFNLLETTMYRSRSENEPKLPRTRSEINFQNYYLHDINHQSILLFDSDPMDANRVVVFGSQQALSYLAGSDSWYCDGAVKSCPKMFAQVFTIHAFISGQQFPLIYAMLPDKTEQTYRRLLRVVLERMQQLNFVVHVRLVLSDLEPGFKAAVESVFGPQLPHINCYSHFCQELWREIKDRGLDVEYRDDPQKETVYRMFMALGLVLSDRKMNYFQDLLLFCKQNGFDGAVQFAVDFFYPKWMVLVDHRHWTWYGMDVRSNSNVEAWNQSFNHLVNNSQRNFNKFLHRLIKQHDWAMVEIAARNSGNSKTIGTARFLENNERSRSAMANIHLMNPISYLRSLAVLAPVSDC